MNGEKYINKIEVRNLLYRSFILMSLAATLGAYYAHANKNKEEYSLSELIALIYISLGGPYFVSSLTSPAFGNFFEALEPFLPAMLNNNLALVSLQKYEHIYTQMKPHLTQQNVRTIDKLLKKLKVSSLSKHTNEVTYTQNIIDMLEYIFSVLNSENVKQSIAFEANNKEKLLNELDKLLSSFSIENASLLKKNVISPFLLSLVENKLKLPSTPVYLLGAPGVGKTWFVNQLAEVLQVPIKKITSIDSAPGSMLGDHELQIDNISPYARAVHYASQNGSKHCILLIDELDKLLANDDGSVEEALLQMLNTDSFPTWIDNYLCLDIDSSNLMVIATGNQDLRSINERFQPIMDRMVTLQFKSLQLANKEKIIFDEAQRMFNQANLSFTTEDKDYLHKIIALDRNPGIRQLHSKLTNYVRIKKVNSLLFLGTSWEMKLESENVEISVSPLEIKSATKIQTQWRKYDTQMAYKLYQANKKGLKIFRTEKEKLLVKLNLAGNPC